MKSLLLTLLVLGACSFQSKLIIPEDYADAKYAFTSTEPLRESLCFIGDAGHGTPNQYLVGKALNQDGCTHIWYLGDVIYQNGLKDADDPQYQAKFAKPYSPLIENKSFQKFHMVMGNHDHRGSVNAWLDLAKKNTYLTFPHYYYVERFGDVCLFVFDTDVYQRTEYAQRSKQNSWIEYQLKAHKDQCKVSIANVHHPYVSSGAHSDSVGALKAFHEKFIIGKFDLLMAGHDHNLSDEGTYQGTRLLISGTASEYRMMLRHPYQGGYSGSHLGYIKLKITGQEITYQFIKVTAVKGEPVTEVAFEKSFTAQGLR